MDKRSVNKGMEKRIKLVVIDIDGCLNPHHIGKPLDLSTLSKIQSFSIQAKNSIVHPQITLNTGRYLNYGEVFTQILAIDDFFGFEMGNAIAKCEGSKIIVKKHPNLSVKMIDDNFQFQKSFLRTFPEYDLYFQKYKQFMTTFIFDNNSPVISDCARDIKDFTSNKGFNFKIDMGHNFINLLHEGINKGTGFRFLLKQTHNLSSENVATIGDSNSDWDFMRLSGFSACPYNASEQLKKQCDYVAKNSESKGTLEILREIAQRNKYLLEE